MDKINIEIKRGKVNLGNAQGLVALDILYKGGFIGEVFGESLVRMNNKRIIILFFELPSDGVLMNYRGKLSFTSIKAYKSDRTPINVTIKYVDDIISKSSVTWGDDEQIKYEDFKETRNYFPSLSPVLSYTYKQKQKYINPKGRIHINKLNKNEKNTLNRIRSDYGVIKK